MNKRKIMVLLIVAILALLSFAVFASEPGSEADPLVTKSYIDNQIESLKSYINEKLENNVSEETDKAEPTDNSFVVLRLAEGQVITFGESAEFIVRMGKGAIISSEKGGIADITKGADLVTGDVTTANHLMIVPVDDGRGFEALEDVIVMAKGSYKIR